MQVFSLYDPGQLAARKDRGQLRSVHVRAAPVRILTGKQRRALREKRGRLATVTGKEGEVTADGTDVGEIGTVRSLHRMVRFTFRVQTACAQGIRQEKAIGSRGISRKVAATGHDSRLPAPLVPRPQLLMPGVLGSWILQWNPLILVPLQIIADDRRPGLACRVSIRHFRVLDLLRPGKGSRWGRPTAETRGKSLEMTSTGRMIHGGSVALMTVGIKV
ncbi:hypothetical protein N7532_000446 [Penicillium argentinense]|uniref:Uncharacterized protein n=1 Tax=Penicillium argentinense TaxID=1131581 RepID=A0A9W9G5I6_9EURO|nr:uncharacterized protein N7532_000446 [Penicillium argentinense]KAJ5112401.1 hypothetical protein N7532_000446 [Penicillium argentinense]